MPVPEGTQTVVGGAQIGVTQVNVDALLSVYSLSTCFMGVFECIFSVLIVYRWMWLHVVQT